MRFTKTFITAAAVLALGVAQAAPMQLLTNGNFELGNYTGWTTTSQAGSSGALTIDTRGTTTPASEQSRWF